jgi:DNA-directed RNA polymerase specialized sigma24 family protein
LSNCSCEDARCVENTPSAPDHSPEAALLLAELHRRLLLAAAQLVPSQQDLFVRHFLQGRSLTELALVLGRTPNALRRARWALRRRLCTLLARDHLDYVEACDYVCLFPLSHGPSAPVKDNTK